MEIYKKTVILRRDKNMYISHLIERVQDRGLQNSWNLQKELSVTTKLFGLLDNFWFDPSRIH